ncbi:hypothetical protein SAMN05216412_10332 [Nitrosospira multiformis]|uniref:Uncharacterized protein n=1 Tax=Nitrosospira multiformis TaxID=1231 RepID=A0A1I0BIL0_9PROT|nr:hypothetical protein [Nitrosospira multiformis]SET06664.1 hypothetical protein SAMN05216412_10332 [Nitrosospira multiformis]
MKARGLSERREILVRLLHLIAHQDCTSNEFWRPFGSPPGDNREEG